MDNNNNGFGMAYYLYRRERGQRNVDRTRYVCAMERRGMVIFNRLEIILVINANQQRIWDLDFHDMDRRLVGGRMVLEGRCPT